MTDETVYAGIQDVMCDVFDDDDLRIGPQTTAADVEGWDSQAHVMLIVALEQRFGIRFNTAELDSLHNVGDLAVLIGARCAR